MIEDLDDATVAKIKQLLADAYSRGFDDGRAYADWAMTESPDAIEPTAVKDAA